MRMDRRSFVERVGAIAAVVVFLGMAARNVVLEQRFRSSSTGFHSPSATSDRFAPGDAILRLPLYDEAGSRIEIRRFLASGVRQIYFYSPHCHVCQERWPKWVDFVSREGYDGTLFVETDAGGPLTAPAGMDPKRIRLARLGRPNPLRGKLPFVPFLVQVNDCGVVESADPSENRAPAGANFASYR